MRAPRLSLAARLLLLGLGALAALLLAELGLRIYGTLRAPPTMGAGDDGALRLLCVGDSFAYGLGAEDGRGPCEHLEAQLEEAGWPGGVAAYNRAVPGFNSSQAADALPAALDEAQPDVVVITVGHNNGWNFAGLHLDPGEGGAGLRALRHLGELRLVKLAQLLVRYDAGREPVVEPVVDPAVQGWFDRQNRAAKAEKRAAERARHTAFLQEHPDDVFTMVVLAELAREEGDPESEARWRHRAETLDAQAARRAQDGLRRVERWHRDNARDGIERHLIGSDAARAELYQHLGGDEATLDDQQALLEQVLRRDLASMVATVRARGSIPIVSGYPGDKPANRVLEAQAAALQVAWVDQRASFDALLARDGDPGRWFVPDGHCTSEGYAHIAQNLAPLVRQAGAGLP
jgi:lysophospholipase L1-like esterase